MPLRYVELDPVGILAAPGPYNDCGKNVKYIDSMLDHFSPRNLSTM